MWFLIGYALLRGLEPSRNPEELIDLMMNQGRKFKKIVIGQAPETFRQQINVVISIPINVVIPCSRDGLVVRSLIT